MSARAGRPNSWKSIHPTGPGHLGGAEQRILAPVNPERLRRMLTKMLDENEFLSPIGIRSPSKLHEQHPYIFNVGGQEHRVDYLPAESNTGLFGGNSNWRGPIWMPVNALIIRALQNFYLYYGDDFKIECPNGSAKPMTVRAIPSGATTSSFTSTSTATTVPGWAPAIRPAGPGWWPRPSSSTGSGSQTCTGSW